MPPIPKLSLQTLSPYQLHKQRWSNCQGCQYSRLRKKVVLGKGDLPCHILFIGEAPGDSEDILGDPFVGQAGRRMNEIVYKSRACEFKVSFSNLLGCIPKDPETQDKEQMDHDCIKACSPRLREWIMMASPLLIVTVGKEPTEYLDQTWKDGVRMPDGMRVPMVSITHPSAIQRAPYVQRGLMTQKAATTIRKGIEQYVEGKI